MYQDDIHNSYLLRIEATDKDLDKNSIIKYSLKEPITSSSHHFFISIHSQTGVIRLAKDMTKSITTPFNEQLNISLIAHDSGDDDDDGDSLSSETYLLINIMPNVHLAPQFDRSFLEFFLVENMPIRTVVGEIRARDPDLGMAANIVYKILDDDELFELRPSGSFNSALLVTKFVSDYDDYKKKKKNAVVGGGGDLIEIKVRAYSSFSSASVLFTDILVRVIIQDLRDYRLVVPNPVRIVFNNYKNYFLTQNSAFIPVYGVDEADNVTFSLLDSVGKQVVDIDARSGEITFKPILNSNNLINVSFLVGVDGELILISLSKCYLFFLFT